MTAHATIEERQRCLAAGMNDHISKPIDPALAVRNRGPGLQTSVAADVQSAPASAEAEESAELTSAGCNPTTCRSSTGLDTKDGLSRVAGNRKLYLKLLRQFVEQQGPAVAQITGALASGDTALAERLAHTLKGVAGNIGAKPVQTAAGALEKLIRDKARTDEIETAKQQVTAALDPLVEQLKAALGSMAPETPAPTATPAAANPAQSREAATQLSKLLSEFDPGAADFIEANQAALRPLFAGDTWSQFEKLVQGYAFADAQAQLEQALKNLTST